MEGAAGRGGEVDDDRGDDASRGAGDEEHGVLVRLTGDVVLGRALHERCGPSQLIGVADFDRARIEQGLVEQRLRNDRRIGLILTAEVDRLDQRVRPLTGERLGEPGDRAAENAERAGVVVAVASAETGGADEECRFRQRRASSPPAASRGRSAHRDEPRASSFERALRGRGPAARDAVDWARTRSTCRAASQARRRSACA